MTRLLLPWIRQRHGIAQISLHPLPQIQLTPSHTRPSPSNMLPSATKNIVLWGCISFLPLKHLWFGMPCSLFIKVCSKVRQEKAPWTILLGYYTDSILKFRLTFPSNYPEGPPVVQFLTDIFHPLISQQDGVFNLVPRFRPWRSACVVRFPRRETTYMIYRPKEHHVFHVLHWIKAAFKKHALDGMKESDCLNKEAFRWVGYPHSLVSKLRIVAQTVCCPTRKMIEWYSLTAFQIPRRNFFVCCSSNSIVDAFSIVLCFVRHRSPVYGRDTPWRYTLSGT
jgi:hypothetical protein